MKTRPLRYERGEGSAGGVGDLGMMAKSLGRGGLLDRFLKWWPRSPFWRLAFSVPGVALVLVGFFAVKGPIPVICGILVALAPALMTTMAEFLDKREAKRAARDRVFEPLRLTRLPTANGLSLLFPRFADPLFFYSRHDEWRRLGAWLSSSSPVMILDGGPLTGKSRLAVEWGDSLGTPWFVGWLRPNNGAQALAAISASKQDTVIIVEGPSQDLFYLLSELRDHEGPRVKVLIIARSALSVRDYVMRLGGAYEASMFEAGVPIHFDNLGEPSDHQRWFEELCRYYADKLNVPIPASNATFVQSLGSVPIGLLHVAAFATARAGKVPPGGLDTYGLMHELWKSEVANWDKAGQATRWGLANISEAQLEKAILAMAMLEEDTDIETALEVLQQIPDLSATDVSTRKNIVGWAQNNYPADNGDNRLGFEFKPRVFAEAALIGVSENDKEFGTALLRALPESAALRTVDRLVDGTQLFPQAAAWLGVLIANDAERLRTALERAAGIFPSPAALDAQLARSVVVCHPDNVPEDLRKIMSERGNLPMTMAALSEIHLAQLRSRPSNSGLHKADMARALRDHSLVLRTKGERDQALSSIDEAVGLYWALVKADPSQHSKGLASALTDQAVILRDAGRPGEALVSVEEAITLYRELDPVDSDLAIALLNRSASLVDRGGRFDEAIRDLKESIALSRNLVESDFARYGGQLTNALSGVSIILAKVGLHAEASSAFDEAVTLARCLFKENPAQHAEGLAIALMAQATVTRRAGGHTTEGLDSAEEAVALRRRLAANNPARYEPELANDLSDLSGFLHEAGKRIKALDTAKEAVTLFRRLAANNPTLYESGLARGLGNLYVCLNEAGRGAEALGTAEEAVALFRRLAANNPTLYEPDLAKTLINRSLYVKKAGHAAEALKSFDEALSLYRRAAANDSDQYELALAEALKTGATYVIAADSKAKGTGLLKEALDIFEGLARRYPAQWQERYVAEVADANQMLDQAGMRRGTHSILTHGIPRAERKL